MTSLKFCQSTACLTSLTKFEESVKVEEILKTAIKLELIAREQKKVYHNQFYKNNNIGANQCRSFAWCVKLFCEVKRRYGVVKSSEAFVNLHSKFQKRSSFARFSKLFAKII